MKKHLIIFLVLGLLLAVAAPAAADQTRGGGSSYFPLWSPDGRKLIVLDLNRAVLIYDSSDLTAAPRVIPVDSSLGLASGTEAISPDGTILAAASYVEPFVQLWDLTTLELLPPIPADLDIATDETMRAVRFSPDGTILAVQTTIAVHLIDLASGTELAEFEASSRGSLAFSPDGTTIVVPICQPIQCDAVGGILAWDVTAGEIVDAIETDEVFNQLIFISDTELLARKRTTGIFVLDLKTGEETLVYDGPYGEISYSLQNDLIGTSMMSTIALINRQNPSEPLKLYLDVQWISHVVLNPAGTMFAAGVPNGSVEVRDTSSGAVIAQLEPGADLSSAGISETGEPTELTNTSWKPVIQEFDSVKMVQVPAGCFMMGSETGEPDEMPVHEVCLDTFWMDRTEVTNAQFAAFGGQAGRNGKWTEDNYPRESITWDEAQAFCESRGGRLPTEAEWEYAARGPEGWIYPWGNEFGDYNAVYSETADNRTRDVTSHLGGASWVGALDMIGNVYEWTADWYGPYSEEKQVNPTGPESGKSRTLRGGAYYLDETQLWAANRAKDIPGDKGSTIGFRCVRSSS